MNTFTGNQRLKPTLERAKSTNCDFSGSTGGSCICCLRSGAASARRRSRSVLHRSSAPRVSKRVVSAGTLSARSDDNKWLRIAHAAPLQSRASRVRLGTHCWRAFKLPEERPCFLPFAWTWGAHAVGRGVSARLRWRRRKRRDVARARARLRPWHARASSRDAPPAAAVSRSPRAAQRSAAGARQKSRRRCVASAAKG